jgi:hypothetical protein
MASSGLKFSSELSVMIGMANIGFTENQSTLTGPNISEAASGSISSINAAFHYRLPTESRYAWFVQSSIPLISNSVGTYFSGGGGLEYSWGQSASRSVLKDSTTSLVVSPVTRYFVGGELNVAYMAYTTLSAKKSDTLLELGGFGGVSRKLGRFHLRVQGGVGRGVGVTTSTIGIKAMAGLTTFFD